MSPQPTILPAIDLGMDWQMPRVLRGRRFRYAGQGLLDNGGPRPLCSLEPLLHQTLFLFKGCNLRRFLSHIGMISGA